MLRFWILVGIFVFVTALLGITSPMEDGVSISRLFGLPLVGINPEEPVILALGGGLGVVVLGVGIGVISIGVGGAGVLFGTGQLACGAIAFGQVGIGLVFFCGQGGVGLTGVAQAMLGIERYTQGDPSGREYFVHLAEEVRSHLTFRTPEKLPY